jgi:hypothetical protein
VLALAQQLNSRVPERSSDRILLGPLERMATLFKVPNRAAADACRACKFILRPVEQASGRSTGFRAELRHCDDGYQPFWLK